MKNNRVYEITCGVLYSTSFTLLDKGGSISDKILYNNNFFSPEYFPKVVAQSNLSRSLINEEKGHSLEVSSRNVLYTHCIQENFEEEFSQFKRRVCDFLIPDIVEKNNLVIQRVGIVFSCEISNSGIAAFASNYFRPELKHISDFRFSKKESTTAGLFNDKADFINKIYTVGEIKEGLTGISFDYQVHYKPPRTYISKLAPSIFDRSKKLLYDEVLNLGE